MHHVTRRDEVAAPNRPRRPASPLASAHWALAGNKPARAVDSCFDADGQLLHAGDDVWDGILDDDPTGACTAQFPTYSTSRIVGGAPFTGDVFKCVLQGVDQAVAAGVYGDVAFSPEQRATLGAIFPDGVCDHTQRDARRPAGW